MKELMKVEVERPDHLQLFLIILFTDLIIVQIHRLLINLYVIYVCEYELLFYIYA